MTSPVVPPLAVNAGWREILRVHHLRIVNERLYGPMGMALTIRNAAGLHGSILATQAAYADDVEWLHTSIAWQHVMPAYEDLQILHRAFFGRKRYAYQVFAPESEHVSGEGIGMLGHKYALHVWGRVDGKPVLPEFGSFLGTV